MGNQAKAKQFNQNSIQISILHNRKSLPNKPKQESWINLVYVHTHTVTARCVLYTERNVMGRCVSWLHTDTRVRSQRISHSKKTPYFINECTTVACSRSDVVYCIHNRWYSNVNRKSRVLVSRKIFVVVIFIRFPHKLCLDGICKVN